MRFMEACLPCSPSGYAQGRPAGVASSSRPTEPSMERDAEVRAVPSSDSYDDNAFPEVHLFGVNKFLASGKSTNSDWGRAPARLSNVIEQQILRKGNIEKLLQLFSGQPWLKFVYSGVNGADQFQTQAMRAAEFAIRNADKTGFTVAVQGKPVTNYLAVGPGRTILVCWEGSWTSRYGTVQNEIMYQIVVPYLEGLTKSKLLRTFLQEFSGDATRRVQLSEWQARDSLLFRQACKAIWNIFPDLGDAATTDLKLPEEATCTICLEDMEQGTEYFLLGGDALGLAPTSTVKTKCGHYYHCSCIEGWLALKSKCPVCRRDPLH